MTTTVVAGLGRCGTSMLMQMLSRGGVACVGQWPAFEVEEARFSVAPGFIAASAGKAVKVLDPQRVGLPGDVRVVWLDRDHRQQAKSHAKIMSVMFGRHCDRGDRRRLAELLLHDTAAALGVIGSRPLLRLRFEDVLRDPLEASIALWHFLGEESFVVSAAAHAVRARSPACAPGLDMELSLIGG